MSQIYSELSQKCDSVIGRCVLVTGTGLGLEHPDWEREDLLLAEGDVVAGVAPVRPVAEDAPE